MKKYYIIYEVEKNEKGEVIDLHDKYDSINPQKVCEWLGISYNHLSDYSSKSTNNIKCKLKENKYFIFKGHTNIIY